MSIQGRRFFYMLVILLACSIPAFASDDRVQFLGDYINVESVEGEHCEGYDIQLWKYKGSFIGFLNHHRGLCGDPPMGILEDVAYSAQTGSLSFKVKLSDGLTSDKEGKWVPTRDIIEFKGVLQGDRLEGTITWFREGRRELVATESVALSLSKDSLMDRSYYTYESYNAWMKYWEPILKARGPRW